MDPGHHGGCCGMTPRTVGAQKIFRQLDDPRASSRVPRERAIARSQAQRPRIDASQEIAALGEQRALRNSHHAGIHQPRPPAAKPVGSVWPVTLPSHVDHLVVGAGFAGVALAIGLQDDGEEFVVIDKADGLGGTWWVNTYPGATCDVPEPALQLLVRAQPRLDAHLLAAGRDPGVRREGRRRRRSARPVPLRGRAARGGVGRRRDCCGGCGPRPAS